MMKYLNIQDNINKIHKKKMFLEIILYHLNLLIVLKFIKNIIKIKNKLPNNFIILYF